MYLNYLQFSKGMHFDSSDFIKGKDELALLNGCNTDYKLGSIVKDLGYSQIGDALQANKAILGMFNFRQASGTQKMLALCNDATDDDTQLFYSTGAGWTEVTGAETAWANEANGEINMDSLDAYCYFVGYDATDGFLPPRTLTGTTFGTTNTTSMPNAKYIKRYRDRIYIGNTDISGTATPYRTYFSTVPSGGTITWTVATNFLDVDYSEWVTGLGENWDRLMIFTEYSAYNYDQTTWKKLWDVGCSAHRTIKNSGAYMLWANAQGVWMSTGGRPVNISGKIDSFIKAATPTSLFAEVVDEQYYLYLGNVTVKGISYTNCCLIYNIPHSTWHIRQFYNTVNCFAKYNSSGKLYLWLGISTGEVHQLSKYSDTTPIYADDGNAIKSEFRTGKLDFGVPQDQKRISKLMTYTEYTQSLALSGRVVDSNSNVLMDWQHLMTCNKFINDASINLKGNFLEIKGFENSTNRAWTLDGLSYLVELDTHKK